MYTQNDNLEAKTKWMRNGVRFVFMSTKGVKVRKRVHWPDERVPQETYNSQPTTSCYPLDGTRNKSPRIRRVFTFFQFPFFLTVSCFVACPLFEDLMGQYRSLTLPLALHCFFLHQPKQGWRKQLFSGQTEIVDCMSYLFSCFSPSSFCSFTPLCTFFYQWRERKGRTQRFVYAK